MSERITSPGTYRVILCNPFWQLMAEKDGDAARMELVLPGMTDDDQTITAYLMFTKTIVQKGKNKGRPLYEINADTCLEIGMSEPFSPEKVEELGGLYANFVVQEEEYEGKTSLKVAFINPAKDKLDVKKAKAVWAELLGKVPDPEPEPGSDMDEPVQDDLGLGDDKDNLPFG